MKPYFLLIPALLLFGCKSNKEMYNSVFQTMKEKSEKNVAENNKTAMNIPDNAFIQSKDTTDRIIAERVTIVLGDKSNLSDFNVVAGSFINRTNARSFYSRMKEDENLPAVLVQNEDLMYRIIIASFKTEKEAIDNLAIRKKAYPQAWILRTK